MEEKYRICIQVGQVRFELESSDKSWVKQKEEQYLKNILEKARTLPASAEQFQEAEVERGPPFPEGLTINEFYQRYVKGTRSRPVIAVFFVYYLEKIVNKDEVRTEDVIQCFGEISYPNYNKLNMTDVLRRSKKRGFLNYINKMWRLTTTGVDYVLNSMTSVQ